MLGVCVVRLVIGLNISFVASKRDSKPLHGNDPRSSKTQESHMSYSLNFLNGVYIGNYIGDYYRGY